jgi:PmbA protein
VKKEFITVSEKETVLRIQACKIEAVRSKDIVKKGVRVYESGKIGISGAVGDVADDVLVERAVENLATDIAYDYPLESNLVESRNYNKNPMTAKTLIDHTEAILEELRTNYTDFDFFENVGIREKKVEMRNTEGLHLTYEDALFSLSLVLKEKGGPNVFDGFLVYQGRTFDRDAFWKQNHEILNAYRTKVSLPEGDKLPVFMLDFEALTGILARSLNGENYATGSSLFKGKLGEPLFDSRVNLYQWGDSKETFEPFFDREGCLTKGDKLPLIENGKLVSVFTDKRTAKLYNLPHTGAAAGAYDGMPTLSAPPLRLDVDTTDIQKTLGGQLAALVVIAAGGDFTTDGDFASPVQVAFLFDGKNILGKLPEFGVRSNLYKLLSEDYIGTFQNPLYFQEDSVIHGHYMEITK